MSSTAYIAFGSNVGNRVINIQRALSLLKSSPGVVRVVDTSFLYQTMAMYVTDQRMFLNTCCEVQVSLSAEDLLRTLQTIELELGKSSVIPNGPRSIDCDILFFDSKIIESDVLVVPHPRMKERFFVLTPLMDICPDFMHPVLKTRIKEMHAELLQREADECVRVFPAINDDCVFPLGPRSYVMGILNVTPDSFSDGGLFFDPEVACSHARTMIEQGADIIDVGGESTRPKAEQIGEAEEQRRVIEVIKKIKSEFPTQPVSIDTYKASTAKLAVEAGASIVNDVSGGMLDPAMLATVAALQVPYICMHAGKVGSYPAADYGDSQPSVFESPPIPINYLEIIKSQLSMRMHACIAAGVFRWNIVLDPGLGFGKNADVNFGIVRNLDKLFSGLENFPIMIGASRKRFVRDIVHGRDWSGSHDDSLLATAAVAVASVSGAVRVDIHRVHDVREIRNALVVSDRIYRC